MGFNFCNYKLRVKCGELCHRYLNFIFSDKASLISKRKGRKGTALFEVRLVQTPLHMLHCDPEGPRAPGISERLKTIK